MSFLDGLFEASDLEVNPDPIDGATALVEPGFVHVITSALAGDAVTITIAPGSPAQYAGMHIAFKVSALPSEAEPQLVEVIAPAPMRIESSDAVLGTSATFPNAPGEYREWICSADGTWYLVAGGGGAADLAAHIGAGGDAHALVTDTEAGFISPASQAKLDSLPYAVEWPPRGSHPDNEEWESTVNALPAGWGVYKTADNSMIWDSLATMVVPAGAPTFGTVDPDLIVADAGPADASGIRIDVNSARASHIFWQESNGDQPGFGPAMGRWGLFKKFSVPVGTDASFLISWGEAPTQSPSMLELSGSLQFVLCEGTTAPSLTRKIILAFSRTAPGGGSRYLIKTHSAQGSYPQLYTTQPSERYLVPLYPYAMLIKRGVGWWLRFYDLDGSLRNVERVADLTGTNLVPTWWGICCPVRNTGAGPGAIAAHPYMSSNFMRRWDTAVKVL